MFEVGVKEAGTQLTDLEERLKKLTSTYGKMELNVDFKSSEDLKTFVNALRMLGDGKVLDPLLKRIEQLQVSMVRLGMIPNDINYTALEQQLNKLSEAYKNLDKARGTSAETARQQAANLLKSNIEKEFGMPVNVLNAVMDTYKNMGNTIQENLSKVASSVSSSTNQSKTALEQESSAVNDTVQKLNALVAEKQEVVNAEKRLAEKSQKTADSIDNEGKQAGITEKKIREVGAAVKELNDKVGEKAHGKKSNIASIAGVDEGEANKVSNTLERFMRLLVEIENQMAKIGKIQALGEQSGFSPTLLKNAQTQLDALKKMVESTIKGTPIAEGLVIPASNSQLAQFIQQFGLLKAQYRDIISEADRFNKTTSKETTDAAKNAEKENKKWADSMDYAKTKANELRLTIEKMERIKKVGDNLGLDTSSLSVQIDRLKQNLSTLYGMMGGSKIGGTAQEFLKSSSFKIPLADANTASNILKSSDAYKEASANIRKAESEANKLKVTISNLEAFAHKAEVMGIDTTKLRRQINDLKLYKRTLDNIASGRDRQSVKKFVTADWFLETKREIKDATSSIKREMSNALKPDNEGVNALKEYVSLLKQITSLTKTANRGEALGFDVQTMRNQIALLEQYAKKIEQFANNKGVGFNAWMQATPVYGEARMNIAADQAKMNTAIANEKQTNTHATVQLSESEQRLANAIKGSTDSMRGQSQVLSDLKMMAMQYLSVWGAQSFVSSIIETGGQLEQQRLSLSAILGDMEKASTLFGQIKELALKSPFGVVELDKMSKQLAAYSFEYEELFDWTKRLADISAATGTSVDRLALALGHVRSEGALSGYTLRQFAMANVPVLRMLSENMGISSKEVRERVKKKEISAEDVQDILKQLTEDGGMFANAQETMSEALNAKFKNLRDAFDIMYGEIAEGGVGDKLKELAVVLTQGAKHWERLGKDVLMVAAVMGMGKVAMLLYNKAVGEGTAATLKSAFAAKEREVANLKLAKSYRTLTVEEEAELAMQRKWWSFGSKLNSRNIMVLLSTNKLTVAQLERAVAMGKVSKADAIAAMNLLKLNTAQMQSIKVFGFWGRIGATIANGFRMAGLAVKSFAASVAPLLALTALFELWNRRSEQQEAAKSMSSAMAGVAPGQEAFDLRGSLASSNKLSEEALKSNIEEMKNALEAAGAFTEELKRQVDATENAADKYDILKGKIGEVADKYEELKTSQEKMLEDAWDAGGGYFSDNMAEDAKDFDAAFVEYTKALTVGSKQMKDTLKKWMEIQGLWKDEFGQMTGKQLFEQLSEQDANRFLAGGDRSIYRNRGYDEATRDALEKISEARQKVGEQLAEMKGEQGREFAETLKSMYEEEFNVDLDKLEGEEGEKQKIAFDKWLRETIGRAEGLTREAKEALRNIVIDFTIKLVPHYQVEKPQTAQDVIDQQIGDNKWLSGFFGRQNYRTQVWTVETAQKEVKKFKKLFGDISLSNLDTAPKKLNSLLDGLEETKTNLQSTLSNGLLSDDEKKDIEKSLKETTDSIDLANKALKDVGGKRKKKSDKSKNGSGEDEDARVLRERVRILKEAADSYQYWRDKVGDSGAELHMQDEFGQLLSEQKLQLKNADELKAKLQELRAEYSKKPQTKAMVEAIKEIDKELAQLDRKDFERDTEKFLSKTKIQLDSLTRAWDTFNKVREATGNVELAIQLSGVTYNEGNQNLADALKDKIQRDLDEISAGLTIDLNVNLSDEDIQRKVEEAFDSMKPVQGDGESNEAYAKQYQSRIKGIVEEYQKWRDLQRDVEQRDMDTFGKLIGSAVNLQTQVMKINDEYKELIASLDRLRSNGKLSDAQYGRAKGIADANTNMKLVQATAEYQLLMNGVVTMSKKAAQSTKANFTDALRKQLLAGSITAKEYADKIAEINDKMQNLEDAPNYFQSYMKGGLNGIFDTMNKRGQGYAQEGAKMQQNAQSMINESFKSNGNFQNFLKGIKEMNAGNEMAMMGEGMQQMSGQMANTVAIIDMIVHGIDNFVQGMKRTYDEIREMYDALGYNTDSDGWTDTNTFFSSFSAASASATKGWDSLKNGDVGGVIEGVVGSWTNWITGFAKGHDQKLENHINAMKHNVDALKANTDAIKSARERTLGYDRGVLRSQLSNMYDWDMTRNGEASRAMYLFHSRNSDTSGYSAELENLKAQRKEYINMYNAEDAKKKSSQEALDDYKAKIAELDEQITFFIEDLAKELWDIDFKAWASQISDALWTAFENGEDAIEAFRDTAKDIISDVSKRMMNIHLIEPKMAELEEMLFGKMNSNGQRKGGGAYDSRTGEFNEEETLRILGQFFGEDGEFAKVVNSAEDFYKMAQSVSGIDFSADDSQTATANTIKGITEQTADLIASYVNATRASTANIENLSAQYFPLFYASITSGNASLANIENHTAAIMRSNDAIERSNQAILENLNGLKNKTWKVPMA